LESSTSSAVEIFRRALLQLSAATYEATKLGRLAPVLFAIS
jgi:hypothetical protein